MTTTTFNNNNNKKVFNGIFEVVFVVTHWGGQKTTGVTLGLVNNRGNNMCLIDKPTELLKLRASLVYDMMMVLLGRAIFLHASQ